MPNGFDARIQPYRNTDIKQTYGTDCLVSSATPHANEQLSASIAHPDLCKRADARVN